MSSVGAVFARVLAGVRKASAVVRRGVTVALLALVYLAILPWVSLYLRMRAPRAAGFRSRTDPEVGHLARLRRRH